MTPLLSTGAPSLEAANQAQINELVQRNRTLEHTNQKLVAQLKEEINRSKAFVKEIQDRHEANQGEWKEGCENILSSYRIIQKQLQAELEQERFAIIAEMNITRQEKQLRMQRDYKLKLFQLREEQLERRLEELEEAKSDQQEEQELVERTWKARFAEYAANLKDIREALSRSERDRKETEAKLNKLREENANLDATNETFTTKLRRADLHLEREKDKCAQLSKELNDAKRRIIELTRQVEEWQKLENSEGAEVESQRKQRMTLERQVQELTEKHEREVERLQRALEKEKERAEKVKDARDSWEDEAKDHKREAEKASNLVMKMEKKLEKLKDDLEVERARNPEPSIVHPTSSPSDDVEMDDASTKRRGTSAQPSSTRGPTIKAGLTRKFTDTEGEAPKQQVARKRTGGRKPKMMSTFKPDSDVEEISNPNNEEEEVVDMSKKRKGKAETKEVEDDEPGEEKKSARKRKAVYGDDEDEDNDSVVFVKPPRAKRGARGASQVREASAGPSRGKSKPPSRAASRQPSAKPQTREGTEEGSDIVPTKKKKRKINVFPTYENGLTSTLANFGIGGLTIPTSLSPLKQDEPVPQRSSSFVGNIGSQIKRSTYQR